MKIAKNLPQFVGRVALIVAISKNRAEMYIATEGIISKIKNIGTDFPEYSDREGFFARRGKGQTYGAGSVYERKKEKMEQEFFPVFSRTLNEAFAEYKITDLYLFSPAFQKQFIFPALPKKYANFLRSYDKHNYFGRHPFILLEKIRDNTAKLKVEPTRADQAKLLKIRKTRHKISGRKLPKTA